MSESKEEAKAEASGPHGKIVDGVWVFTPQIALNAHGARRFSHMFVRLVVGRGNIHDTNWELAEEESKPIVAEYLTGTIPIPGGVVAALWSETGQDGGKTLRSAPTYISTGKNLGKKNATNIVQQAISEGMTKWNKNARKGGYVTSADQLATVQAGHIKPMALHSLPAQPPEAKFDITGTSYWKEGQGMYCSEKLDGNRLMAELNATRSEVADLWGRGGDAPPNPLAHIRAELKRFAEVQQAQVVGLILDGEIYKHGLKHQLINGIVMNETADSSELEYHVFDFVDAELTFHDRYKRLTEMFARAAAACPHIKLVPETLLKTSAEIEAFYRKALRAGAEGIVLRNPEGKYEAGARKEVRSKNVLKLKPEFDSEYEIVGYEQGEGRDAGSIIWVLKMPNSTETFTARPADTLENRRELYTEMATKFESAYKGRMLRIAYGDTTASGKPRFPRVVGFRDAIL
jgi:ATP-dependent DNA ligase